MLDLKKYLDRASIDPGFKKRLLQNANQAIKEEFGENLPYQLKCKEKLVFEVEATDGVAESDLKGVAGGDGEEKVQDFAPAPLFAHHVKTKNVCLSPAPPVMNDGDLKGVAGGDGEEKVQDFAPAPLFDHHVKTKNVCLSPAPPIMNDSDLECVAGGGRRLNKNIQAAKELMKQFQSSPDYPNPQPGPSNPATNTSSEPRNPARAVYGANPSARRW